MLFAAVDASAGNRVGPLLMAHASCGRQPAASQPPGLAKLRVMAWPLRMRPSRFPQASASGGEADTVVTTLVQLLQRTDEDVQRKDEDLRRKDEDVRRKDEDLRRKDELLYKLAAELRASDALATEFRFRNLARLRTANVVELRGALEVCVKSAGLRGGGAATFAALLATLPLGTAALSCCNQDAKVVSDNGDQLHTVDTLAQALSQIMRRLNKDLHPKNSPGHYTLRGDRLMLARNGLSDSDVVISSCVLKALGYPVEIVDEAQLGGPG